MAYGTTADALTYHAARGNAAWAALSSDAQSAALQRGSDYIDRNFRNRFPGVKTGGAAQFEEWPRVNATYRTGESIESDTVPKAVEYAAYEAALIEATAPGSLLRTYSEDSRKIAVKAGSVEVQYQQLPRSGSATTPINRAAVPFEYAQGDSRAAVVVEQIEGLLSGILISVQFPVAFVV